MSKTFMVTMKDWDAKVAPSFPVTPLRFVACEVATRVIIGSNVPEIC